MMFQHHRGLLFRQVQLEMLRILWKVVFAVLWLITWTSLTARPVAKGRKCGVPTDPFSFDGDISVDSGVCWEWFCISCFACFLMDFLVCLRQVGSQVAFAQFSWKWLFDKSFGSLLQCLARHLPVQFRLNNPCLHAVPRVSSSHAPWLAPKRFGGKMMFWYLLLYGFILRVGEAFVPGPELWTIGTCNPAGLHGKCHLLADDSTDILVVAETHLTSAGCYAFRQGLRKETSTPRWFVPGYPVKPRSDVSACGSWSGVGIFSHFPTHALPHDWTPWAFESSRLVATTSFCNHMWISGVGVYGMPTGPTHPQAVSKTDSLIREAVRRVLCMDGPRFLGGDFNHDLDNLPSIELLREHNFVEVQDAWHTLWGVPPKPTCRMKTRRDFLFISPELLPMLCDVAIDHCKWIDHATVTASFKGANCDIVRFPWPLPKQLPWQQISTKKSPGSKICFDTSVSCEVGYTELWQSIEQDVCHAAREASVRISCQHLGRGKRRKPVRVVGTTKPMMPGRRDEIQPKYFGISFLHRAWFRQLRRVQSYIRIASVASPSTAHVEHAVSLWHAIFHAKGFKPSFAEWWLIRDMKTVEEPGIPEIPPDAAFATLVFEGLQVEVRDLEQRLCRDHRGHRISSTTDAISRLYRSVKQDMPAQVDVLVDMKQAVVSELDEHDCAIVLNKEVSWHPDQPIRIDGVEVPTHFVASDKIWLSSLQDVSVGASVAQNCSIGKLESVFQAFVEHWSQYWNKHVDVPSDRWNQVIDFARDKLGFQSLPSLSLTSALVRATVKSKKSQAATGLDGVTREDLLNLSHNQLHGILMVYQHAQATGQWPPQVLEGVVKSLAKVDCPSQVAQFRPITVFSLVYRAWSSLQSRYWLGQIEHQLSQYLCGNRSGYQAATLWRKVLEEIEWCQVQNKGLCGLIIDLTKAFNQLPRLPCLAAALLCGVDASVVNAWAGALSGMRRRFWIRGSVSDAVGSNRGFPEGCGLSCLSMLLLTQLWHLWVTERDRLASPMSYVDNWEVLCSNPQSIVDSLDATLSFVSMLDLQVDERKTCVWAIGANDRKQLKALGLKVVHDIRDLGAHLVFSKQIRNATVQQRFASLDRFWQRLRRANGGFHSKVRVIRTAGWPRALHGISATLVGRKRFHSLRVKMVRSLALNKPGTNAFLVGLVVGNVDPSFLAIVETLRDWRRLGDRQHQLSFLSVMHSNEDLIGKNTVTQVLQQRIHTLGWSLCADGTVFVPGQSQHVDLKHAHWAVVLRRLEESWLRVVCSHVAHRPSFRWLCRADVSHTRQAVAKMLPRDQGIMRRLLIGSTFTNEHACYWSEDGNAKCIKCGADDSLHHRFWRCPGTCQHREALDCELLNIVDDLPAVLVEHGWTLRSHMDEWWEHYLCQLPVAIPEPLVQPHAEIIDVFTDGSCFWPQEERFRVAAWAACVAGPVHVNADISETRVLGSGHLPGPVQTAFRAELMALRVVLQWAVHWGGYLRIWIDCQGVIDRFQLHVVGSMAVTTATLNSDLWHDIVDSAVQVGVDRIQLVKVDSHAEITEDTPEALRWARLNNGAVDRVAKECNLDRGTQFWERWQQHADRVVQLQQIADQIRQHQIRVLADWQETLPPDAAQTQQPRKGKVHPMKWCDVFKLDEVPAEAKSILGSEFSRILLEWWNSIVDWDQSQLQWISFAQLYVHFQRAQRHPGLVKKGRRWHNPVEDDLIIPENFSFRERSRWFRLALQQLWKSATFHIGTASTRPMSQTLLCHIGCVSMPICGFVLDDVETWFVGRVDPIKGCGAKLDSIPVAW